MGYLGVKLLDYQQQVRDYDTCVGRVERSIDSFGFNNELVTILEEELPERADITERLRSRILKPLVVEISCGSEPTFLTSFSS